MTKVGYLNDCFCRGLGRASGFQSNHVRLRILVEAGQILVFNIIDYFGVIYSCSVFTIEAAKS